MNNLDLYEKFRSVPDEAKKEIKAGRTKGFTDINPMWRIKTLTEAFGPAGIGWYYKVINKWIETVGNEVAAFADIELYVKVDNEWSMPIPGTGGSRLATVEKNGVYVSDECYKMAVTDALSVACKLLGIGADVYFSNDKTKYDKREEVASKEDIKKIRELISRKREVKESKILEKYGIKKLEELPKNMVDGLIHLLNKYQDTPPKSPNEPAEPNEYGGLPFK